MTLYTPIIFLWLSAWLLRKSSRFNEVRSFGSWTGRFVHWSENDRDLANHAIEILLVVLWWYVCRTTSILAGNRCATLPRWCSQWHIKFRIDVIYYKFTLDRSKLSFLPFRYLCSFNNFICYSTTNWFLADKYRGGLVRERKKTARLVTCIYHPHNPVDCNRWYPYDPIRLEILVAILYCHVKIRPRFGEHHQQKDTPEPHPWRYCLQTYT
jgi:hypothetical protein